MEYFEDESIHDKLFRLLKLRCVFPCNLGSQGDVARCMLESEGSKAFAFEDATEDVIVKIFHPLSPSKREVRFISSINTLCHIF